MAVALAYGLLVQDRLPLYLCKRWGKGVWKPEYRLWSLWIPAFFLYPIGLGLFGAALEYHLHYMVLAFAFFLAVTTTIMSAPPTINYISECFTHHATDATAILNFYRSGFGIAVPFFLSPWLAKVGVGWVFGMMAFISLFAFSFPVLLMARGHDIRELTLGNLSSSEEGAEIKKDVHFEL